MNKIIQNFHPYYFWQLLRTKSTNMRTTLTDKLINLYIWGICSLFVYSYVMQAFGLANDFGPFQLGGILASIGLFEVYSNAVTIVSDIEGDRTITYYLSLPAPAFTILASFVCYYAFISITMGILLLPLAKIILGSQFVLANVSWLSLILFISLINLFYATATLLLSALIPSMDKFDILWTRFIYPIWFLGGFQFSWKSVHDKVPWFSYIILVNPVTYATEGIRAVLLGQTGYLPFWLCCLVIFVLWIFVAWGAYKTLKKRLDFV